MTHVEPNSTARTGGRTRLRLGTAALAGAVIAAAASIGIVAPYASADPVAAAKAQAAQISAQVAADGQKLDAFEQQYEGAQAKVAALQSQIAQAKATIAADQAAVSSDQANLRNQALDAYMAGGNATGLESLFSSTGNPAASEYQSVASNNVSTAVDALSVAENKLTTQESQLQGNEDAAAAALAQVDAARSAAEAAMADQQAALSHANGQVAALIAQQQSAQEAAAHAAYLAQLAAQRNAASNTASNVPAAGGAAKAVAAAESQIGVPYQWGGEDPGVGFDCSGLTQWSWAQAGVSLPRTAAEQYDAVTHIPLSAMQPGDLVFWSDGSGISHVAIYIGNGDVVHAPNTGSTVRIQAIWDNGLVGAGRP